VNLSPGLLVIALAVGGVALTAVGYLERERRGRSMWMVGVMIVLVSGPLWSLVENGAPVWMKRTWSAVAFTGAGAFFWVIWRRRTPSSRNPGGAGSQRPVTRS
jgi:hypothetical protein